MVDRSIDWPFHINTHLTFEHTFPTFTTSMRKKRTKTGSILCIQIVRLRTELTAIKLAIRKISVWNTLCIKTLIYVKLETSRFQISKGLKFKFPQQIEQKYFNASLSFIVKPTLVTLRVRWRTHSLLLGLCLRGLHLLGLRRGEAAPPRRGGERPRPRLTERRLNKKIINKCIIKTICSTNHRLNLVISIWFEVEGISPQTSPFSSIKTKNLYTITKRLRWALGFQVPILLLTTCRQVHQRSRALGPWIAKITSTTNGKD